MHLVEGLAHMHACGVAHRDVTPDNLLLRGGDLKIADLGMSRALCDRLGLDGRPAFSARTTSVCYMAPELLGCRDDRIAECSTAIDVWSAGCVVFEILTGRRAFSHDGYDEERLRMVLCDAERRWGASRLEMVFLRRMLEVDPGRRATCCELLSLFPMGSFRQRTSTALAAVQRRAIEQVFALGHRRQEEDTASSVSAVSTVSAMEVEDDGEMEDGEIAEEDGEEMEDGEIMEEDEDVVIIKEVEAPDVVFIKEVEAPDVVIVRVVDGPC